jgi:hypothetical protein
MRRSTVSRYSALLLAILWAGVILPISADAASNERLSSSAKSDRCAHVFSGSIPYDHGQYHWFCSGKQSAPARTSTTFSLQCGPGTFDKRKHSGYWVSSSALTLTKVAWVPGYAELDLTFHKRSSKQQMLEFWESCLKAS